MPPPLGTRIGRYELLAPLGAGGMGEVFRARDLDLGRDVAIKFLRSRFAGDPARLARFSQEARAASSLNHPNIVTIHEVGDFEGQPYIVMEFVEGDTLRTMMSRGALPAREALDLGAQLADGLGKAHAAGIVHRDLKPENVIVTSDGFAKIVDFGLAKLRTDADASAAPSAEARRDAETVTRLTPATGDGAVLGTVGYMSPEQAAGMPVDYRADQFSLGAILYEMAAGKRAFRRHSAVQTLNAVIEADPEPLAEVAPSFPPPARWAVERCLAKKPGDRYASTLDLARELRNVRDHLSETSSAGAPRSRRLMPQPRLWHGVAGVLVLVLGVLFGPPIADAVRERLHLFPLPSARRIAVLPIHAPAGAGEDAAICDGMLDYVVARLGEMQRFQQALWVVPAGEVRESGVTSAAGAGRGLGATLAVEATVQRSGAGYVLTFSLADTGATPPRQLRGTTRRVLATDVLLDEAVDAVVGMLDLEMTPGTRAALKAGGTSVPAASTLYAQGTQDLAHTPYERGLSELQRSDRQQRVEQAIGLFQAALARDPKYALAHAGLAQAYLRLYQLTRRTEYVSLSEQHCQRALALDPLTARPWLALAMLHRETGKEEQSLGEFRQALDREPRSAEVLREMGIALTRLTRFDEAEQTYKQALAVAADSWTPYAYYGVFLIGRNRLDEAEAALKHALWLAPDNARVWSNLGAAYYRHDRRADAEAAFAKSVRLYPTATALSNLATLQFFRRDYAGAVRTFEQAIQVSDRDYRVWRNLASSYYWAPGQRERAAAAYARAAQLAEQERQLDPRNPTLLAALADCRAMTGDAAGARALLAEVLRLRPDDNELLKMVADVYETLGDRADALRLLDLALNRGYPRADVDSSPSFERLRQDPRYASIGRRQAPKGGQNGR